MKEIITTSPDKPDDKNAHKSEISQKAPGYQKLIGQGVATTLTFVLVFAVLAAFVFPNVGVWMSFFMQSLLSLLTLGVIAIQTYIYQRQWTAMRESLDIGQESLKHSKKILRFQILPAITLESAVLKKPIGWGEYPFVNLTAINTGSSPANNVRIEIDFMFVSDFVRKNIIKGIMPARTPFDYPHKNGGALGAGRSIFFKTPPREFTQNERINIEDDGHLFYVWGEIYYFDMQGWPYKTNFCFYATDEESLQLAVNPTYNEIVDMSPRDKQEKNPN
jgi:hypothetical protein